MNRLEKFYIISIVGILSQGIYISVVSNAIVITVMGYSVAMMAITAIFLAGGPDILHWWVPLRLGTKYVMDMNVYFEKMFEISDWLRENIKYDATYYNNNEVFYFLDETNAMAFKLVWEGNND